MSPQKVSRILFRSTLGVFLLLASVQGDHLKGRNATHSLQSVDQDLKPNWVHEQEESNDPVSISCEDKGVFPVTGSCKEFYYCETLNGSPFVLTCPRTTVFDNETKTCIPSTSCKYHHVQRNSEEIRKKRSESSNTACSNEMSESLTDSSREACASTRDIDTFIANLKAVQSLELRSFAKDELKAIIKDYNSDLSLSQSHYDEWRHGKSVFNAIKESFLAAKNFEPTFNTKYEENQKRITEITSENTPDIKKMEEDIEVLKSEIKETQEALSALEGLPSDQGPLGFLKNRLREKEYQLQQLVSDESRIETKRKIAALIDFLEMVRASVVNIQQNAIETSARVETFQQKIITDSSIFLRHRETSQNGVKYLQDQRTENDNEKHRIVAEIANLQNGIQHENNEMSRIRNSLQSTENELIDINQRISRMEVEARERQRTGALLFIIPVAGWIAGGILLGTGIEDEKRLKNQREHSIFFYQNMIRLQQSQIDSKAREILNAQNRISTLTSTSRQLEEELTSFKILDQDLARIQNDINSILPSLNKALASVGKLKTVFDGLKKDIDVTLEVAKSRKEKAEENNLLYFIYNGISELKCKWNQASAKIIALDQCN